jgi:hypothetical protein
VRFSRILTDESCIISGECPIPSPVDSRTRENLPEFRDLPTPDGSGECYIAFAFTRRNQCERSSLPGRRQRTERWKFEAVARVVRLLDTIEAPGSPEHLSRPSDEGKVVETKPCE